MMLRVDECSNENPGPLPGPRQRVQRNNKRRNQVMYRVKKRAAIKGVIFMGQVSIFFFIITFKHTEYSNNMKIYSW